MRTICFYKYAGEIDTLEDFVQGRIRKRLRQERAPVLDERNIYSYRHGHRWSRDISDDSVSEMRSSTAESEVQIDEVINHDTSILQRQIETVVEQLHGQIMRGLFDLVGETAEHTGNTVKRSDFDGDFQATFLAMLEKIEFGVDRYGRPSRPTMYVPPSFGKELLELKKNQSDEHERKVESVINRKEKMATAKEAERISKFRWAQRQ